MFILKVYFLRKKWHEISEMIKFSKSKKKNCFDKIFCTYSLTDKNKVNIKSEWGGEIWYHDQHAGLRCCSMQVQTLLVLLHSFLD